MFGSRLLLRHATTERSYERNKKHQVPTIKEHLRLCDRSCEIAESHLVNMEGLPLSLVYGEDFGTSHVEREDQSEETEQDSKEQPSEEEFEKSETKYDEGSGSENSYEDSGREEEPENCNVTFNKYRPKRRSKIKETNSTSISTTRIPVVILADDDDDDEHSSDGFHCEGENGSMTAATSSTSFGKSTNINDKRPNDGQLDIQPKKKERGDQSSNCNQQ